MKYAGALRYRSKKAINNLIQDVFVGLKLDILTVSNSYKTPLAGRVIFVAFLAGDAT